MKINNEKGYTLILVMIIITVTMTLALALSGMAVNTGMQVNKTDEQNKATDLAEMGITYYIETVKNKVNITKNIASTANFFQELTNQLNNSNIYEQKVVEGQNKFQIFSFEITPPSTTNPEQIKISFKSKGITSNEVVTVNGEVHLKKTTRAGESAPNKNNYSQIPNFESADKIYYVDPYKINANENFIVKNSSAWFKSFTIVGGEKRSITFKHEAIFDDIQMTGQTDTIVEGDAIFLNPSTIDQTQKATICIKGDIYTLSQDKNKLIDFRDYSDYFINSCTNSNPNWGIDPENDISVTY